MRKRVYKLLSVSKTPGDLSWYVDAFIITLILLNVVAVILVSIESVRIEFGNYFLLFEYFSVVVFTIEYLLRLWTANLNPTYKKPIIGNIKYALTPLAIIDLLAVLPFFLPFFGVDLRLLRFLRVFRVFRLLKLARYMVALDLINRVISKKKEELVISFILTGFLLVVAATFMYYVENNAQPDKFSSIPETMWWGIITVTTVGYGDVYPITPLGRFLAGIIAIIGIGLVALPTGILAAGFSNELSQGQQKNQRCPTCGQLIRKK
ncbi:voltage-gated potassium channel [Cyclobacterium xiamenense]|uniref:Voltage-gated potassium channel n=2 Tax=Cyclobacterium xiamenense TaxID=1297121 RepID=A0A1H6WMU1_9BACT|nr:voltage-gated potassium channel [Cyclobacterium xiamenense]